MIVGALVLAAGLGSRMGGAKPAIPVNGRPMVAHVLAAAREAGLPTLLVTGAHAEAVEAAAGEGPSVRAGRHAEGMAESLKAGLAAAPAEWDAALVLLADMPFVEPRTLRRLAGALAAGAPAVVPVTAGRRGNPAGFARSRWPELMGLFGDEGARRLLDGMGVVEVEVDDPGVFRDLDRPEDVGEE